MKKSTFTLCTVSVFCLAFTFGVQADTSTSAPAARKAPIAKEAPTAPGVDKRVDIRPDDPDKLQNEANLRAALEQCNAIVSNDAKTQCVDEAKRNFPDGN